VLLAVDYLAERAERADAEAFERILGRVQNHSIYGDGWRPRSTP
jgi:hypothetical protein